MGCEGRGAAGNTQPAGTHVAPFTLRPTPTIRARPQVLYSSWWLSAILQFTVTTLLCTVMIKQFVINTATWIILLYVGVFCLGAVSFAFFLSVFFSNAVLSAVVGPVAFFGALLPRYLFFGANRYERTQAKIYASLLLPTAFSFAADILAGARRPHSPCVRGRCMCHAHMAHARVWRTYRHRARETSQSTSSPRLVSPLTTGWTPTTPFLARS